MYPTKPIDDKRVSDWALEYTALPIMHERTLRVTERAAAHALAGEAQHCPEGGVIHVVR